MKKQALMVIGMVLGFIATCDAYPMYRQVNLLPVVIEGDVDVTTAGRVLSPENPGGLASATDVDTHQVVIHQTTTFGRRVRIGKNTVEYVPTDQTVSGRVDLLDTFYQVDVTLLPVVSVANAFVSLTSDDGKWYKIVLIQGVGVKLLYNEKGYLVNKVYKFDVQPRHTYRVYLGIVANRVSLNVKELGSSLHTTVVNVANFDVRADSKLMRFFVGTSGGPAVFRNEGIRLLVY